MKYLFPLFLSLLSFQLQATIVVITRTDSLITIGADSKRETVYFDGRPSSWQSDWCKIQKVGPFYYAFVGDNDSLQRFCAEAAARHTHTLDEFYQAFAEPVRKKYNSYLNWVYRHNQEQFLREHPPRQVVARIPLFCFENGKANLFIAVFYVAAVNDQGVFVGYDKLDNPAESYLGYHLDTEAIKHQYTRLLPSDPINYIDRYIKAVVKIQPDHLGGPIDILQLRPTGHRWIRRKKNCLSFD
ncbi:hypothetical protein GO755_24810 [Spirosoma sp. HMF4905]|uniref:Uncharacterized protein n=1 Tax=Spirosoma arboris TaxID=2682092 RepID=A0A7K1SHP5_9BACT|nr:hypothetical protein [Spirosoma arboris]MVM33285.1 hypothetical protein [Spirosoma arboris]